MTAWVLSENRCYNAMKFQSLSHIYQISLFFTFSLYFYLNSQELVCVGSFQLDTNANTESDRTPVKYIVSFTTIT
jgi:hypothetical protein